MPTKQMPVKLQLLFLPLLVADSASAAPAPIMVTGWDSPTPAEFRQHLAEFEKWGVFYGTIPTRRSAGGKVFDAQPTPAVPPPGC
jgi:hypothetical protein